MPESPLVDAQWLAARMASGAVCVLDASWHQPALARDARAEFEQAHIPGARFLDLAVAADPGSELSHTLPAPQHLAKVLATVGARQDELVVIYDTGGMASAARAWWMLSVFSFRDVRVLDGGLPAWRTAGLPVEQGPSPSTAAMPELLDSPVPGRVADHERVRSALAAGRLVVDARPAARFQGEAAEPVPGIRSGHIEGSTNLPYQQLLGADGCFLDDAQLRQRLEQAGVRWNEPVVCSCGSGVTACVLALALEQLGHRQVAVYDGSWTDWARRSS